jgi:hypothetical protein
LINISAALASELDGPQAYPISLIAAADLTDVERAAIPAWWLEAAGMADRAGVAHALRHWDAVLPGLLSQFKEQLANQGTNVYLGRSETKPVLAYVLTEESAVSCWFGDAPGALRHPSLELRELPTMLRQFYTSLHGGFRRAMAFANGFPATSELFPVSDYGVVDEFEISGGRVPDLDQLVPIFFEWSAASIGVELGGDPDSEAGWYIAGGSMSPIPDFWGMADDWLVGRLGEI